MSNEYNQEEAETAVATHKAVRALLDSFDTTVALTAEDKLKLDAFGDFAVFLVFALTHQDEGELYVQTPGDLKSLRIDGRLNVLSFANEILRYLRPNDWKAQ